ncbi:MAG: hypothetical protein CMA12_03225 [Euryarchaeota archaeon]|nr:hypothetical protein [Euryarchaeota archaeon]
MSEENLLSIAGLLSFFLGTISLYLVNRSNHLKWNEKAAGYILSWIFLVKAISYPCDAYVLQITNGGTNFVQPWEYFYALSNLQNFVFMPLCFALSLVFPVSVLRTKNQIKIALLVFTFLVSYRVIVYVSVGVNSLELVGLEYILTTIIWTSNYVHFKIKNLNEPNKGNGRIANISALLLMLHTGFNWFVWVGVFTRSDYFYFEDVRLGLDGSGSFSEYFWLLSLTISICGAICIVITSLGIFYLNGEMDGVGIATLTYLSLGVVTHFVYLSGAGTTAWFFTAEDNLTSTWNIFTRQAHYTIGRPVIAMIILLQYGIYDLSDSRNYAVAKTQSILIIVIATAALMEMVQLVLPIDQTLSAGFLGIFIALGLGWEERTFHGVATNPRRVSQMLSGSEWDAPEIDISERAYNSFNISLAIFVFLSIFLAYVVDVSNVLVV